MCNVLRLKAKSTGDDVAKWPLLSLLSLIFTLGAANSHRVEVQALEQSFVAKTEPLFLDVFPTPQKMKIIFTRDLVS